MYNAYWNQISSISMYIITFVIFQEKQIFHSKYFNNVNIDKIIKIYLLHYQD